jgi:hypothetical protein
MILSQGSSISKAVMKRFIPAKKPTYSYGNGGYGATSPSSSAYKPTIKTGASNQGSSAWINPFPVPSKSLVNMQKILGNGKPLPKAPTPAKPIVKVVPKISHSVTVSHPVVSAPRSTSSAPRPASSGGGGSGGSGVPVVGAGKVPVVAQDDAAKKLKAMEDYLKGSSDAYYKTQEASLGKNRDDTIAELIRAYQSAVTDGNTGMTDVNNQFSTEKKGIDAKAYEDSQLTNLVGFDRGIQNSQQLLGLQAGDASRTNTITNDLISQRDQRINTIKDRISSLGNQKNLDVANANADYGYNTSLARGEADKQYKDSMFQVKNADYNRALDAQELAKANALAQAQAQATYRQSQAGDYSVAKQSALAPVVKSNPLAQYYSDFKKQGAKTNLDNYYADTIRQMNLGTDIKSPAFPPVSVRNNASLSDWQKMRMIQGKSY